MELSLSVRKTVLSGSTSVELPLINQQIAHQIFIILINPQKTGTIASCFFLTTTAFAIDEILNPQSQYSTVADKGQSYGKKTILN